MGQMTEMLQWPKCLSEKINPAFELTASPVTCVSAAHQQWPASRWLWRKRHNPCKPRQCQITRARWMSATPWMPPNRAPYHRWVRRSILACSTCTPAPRWFVPTWHQWPISGGHVANATAWHASAVPGKCLLLLLI